MHRRAPHRPPLHLSPTGRGRPHSGRVRGLSLLDETSRAGRAPHPNPLPVGERGLLASAGGAPAAPSPLTHGERSPTQRAGEGAEPARDHLPNLKALPPRASRRSRAKPAARTRVRDAEIGAERSPEMAVWSGETPRRSVTKPLFVRRKSLVSRETFCQKPRRAGGPAGSSRRPRAERTGKSPRGKSRYPSPAPSARPPQRPCRAGAPHDRHLTTGQGVTTCFLRAPNARPDLET